MPTSSKINILKIMNTCIKWITDESAVIYVIVTFTWHAQILLYSRAMTIKFYCILFFMLTEDYS